MRKIIIGLILLLLSAGMSGCTFLKVNLGPELAPYQETAIAGQGKDKVLVLDLSGVILSGDSGTPLSDVRKPGLLAKMREALDRAQKDRSVKAVVLRINSPGGGVTASDTLYHELRAFRESSGKPIVAHIMDVGASGAYYAALSADAITAQPTSVTGSIGVIMYRVDATVLMEKVGVRAEEIASGERKGLGSPFKRLTDDERKLFQGIIDGMYRRFTDLVAQRRGLAPDAVKKAADGRVMTSDEAKTLGLIDGIGYLEDAVELAKKKAGIAEASVVMYHRPGEYRNNIYSLSLVNIDLGELSEPGAKLMYLWWP